MEERKTGFWLAHYLKDRRKEIYLAAFIMAVYLLIFYLYQVEAEGALFGTGLIAAGLAAAGAVDMWAYRRKCVRLWQRMQEPLEEAEVLPSNLAEELYQEAIDRLTAENRRLISKNDSDRTEMNEYYTLWVHQIKTPIAAMDLLLQRGEGEKDEQLRAELFSISRYVEMALTYVRVDDASSDYVLKQNSLESIVRQAVRKYAAQFVRRRLKLDFQVEDVPVLTDERWLVFAVEQILSNSLKYTASGSVTIRTEPGPVLVIADTGIGIAPEDLPRICEKGFTGYNGHRDKKSTGIGLYLCRKVLQRLGHTIAITSTLGEGTQVRIGLEARPAVRE